MKSKISIECICGRELDLELVGGQYQNTYQGKCECGRQWSLEEQTEIIEEICGDSDI